MEGTCQPKCQYRVHKFCSFTGPACPSTNAKLIIPGNTEPGRTLLGAAPGGWLPCRAMQTRAIPSGDEALSGSYKLRAGASPSKGSKLISAASIKTGVRSGL